MNSYRAAGNRLAGFLAAIVFVLAIADFALGRGQPFSVALGIVLVLIAAFIPQSLMMASQWERAVVLRMGRLHGVKGPGVFWIVPILDRVTTWVDQPSSTPSRRSPRTPCR
jgi:regulator of protease activity HflC (stomatin/prohibitin superfamily)